MSHPFIELYVNFECFYRMADDSLFEFLHMEIVSHIFNEQQSSKGELDNKVCLFTRLSQIVFSDIEKACKQLHSPNPLIYTKIKTVR